MSILLAKSAMGFGGMLGGLRQDVDADVSEPAGPLVDEPVGEDRDGSSVRIESDPRSELEPGTEPEPEPDPEPE